MPKSSSSTSAGSSKEESSSHSPPPPSSKEKRTFPPPKAGPPVFSDSSSDASDDDESSNSKEEESQLVRHQEPGHFAPSNKRSHGDENGMSKSKKVKKAPSVQNPVATEEEKTPATKSVPFGRIFSGEDEVALMRGLAEFCSTNGADAASVVKNRGLFEGFHASVGRTLHTSVTVEQLKNKIRRLKERQVKRGDSALTGMWERLWRSEKGNPANENVKGRSKKNLVENNMDEGKVLPVVSGELPPFLEESVRICSSQGRTMLGEGMLRKSLMLLDKEEIDSLEKKWKKLWVLDMKLSKRMNELERRKNKLINMEFMKISEAMMQPASQ